MTLETHDAGSARRRRADEHWSRRRDLERQLHDGPALRIAALTLRLGLLAQKVRDGASGLPHDIAELQNQLELVLEELREIADQIYPPLLRAAGLGPALCELASRAYTPMRVDAAEDRFHPMVEGTAYYAVLGVLSDPRNAPRTVDVTVRRDAGGLALDLANVDTGHAAGVRARIEWLAGAVEIGGAPDRGKIEVRIPCE
jgi:signal transduction histidine kinase